jgi:hypothetical protein
MRTAIDEKKFWDLIEPQAAKIRDFAVGFVRITAEGPDASIGGSGTLVTIDGAHGILTAAHVIKSLQRLRRVGLVLPIRTHLHRVEFEMDKCPCVLCDLDERVPSDGPDGPDLGIIFPPPDVVSTLRARMSFYNLSSRQAQMLAKPEPFEHGAWIISGFSQEWTTDRSPEPGYAKIKVFKAGYLEAKVTRECVADEYDYLFFEALCGTDCGGPDSYQGFSGGGIWQLVIKPTEDGGDVRVDSNSLSGVAFYQSEKRPNERGQLTREIKCHGRTSVYRALIERVRARMPAMCAQ